MRTVLFKVVENSIGWLSQGYLDDESYSNTIDKLSNTSKETLKFKDQCNPSELKSKFELDTNTMNSPFQSTQCSAKPKIEEIKSNQSENYQQLSSVEENVTFPVLARYLDMMGLSAYLEEITENFTGNMSKGISDWNVTEIKKWISTLKFLGKNASRYANIFAAEYIDGECFMNLSDKELSDLKIDNTSLILLKACRDGWKFGWGVGVPVPRGIAPGVAAGIVSDISNCPPDLKKRLQDADNIASKSGIGATYGQLVVLGYKEYRVSGQTWIPLGISNDKFVLKRRHAASGIQFNRSILTTTTTIATTATSTTTTTTTGITSSAFASSSQGSGSMQRSQRCVTHTITLAKSSVEQITMEYVSDMTKDMFQIGRMSVPQNDMVVRGPLHVDASGVLSGPVSRYACRIVCERLPPYRCFLFAAGFNDHNDIILSESAPKWHDPSADRESPQAWDALTTFGIKIWRPDTRDWTEISVFGNAYGPRPSSNTAGPRLTANNPYYAPNELTDGCLIDIAGVSLLFQNPMTAQRRLVMEPSQLISRLNSFRPQCPVLMHTIRFVHLSAKERAAKALERIETSGEGVPSTGSFHIPPVDYSDVEEDRRPYVFPACGHVHAYSKALEGRPCTLCRRTGPFTPLIFPFEPAICNQRPAYVFNPCGHAASKETCELWASTPAPDISPLNRPRPLCPFCATPLQESVDLGGSYNKINIQFDRSAAGMSYNDVWKGEYSPQPALLPDTRSRSMELVEEEEALLPLLPDGLVTSEESNEYVDRSAVAVSVAAMRERLSTDVDERTSVKASASASSSTSSSSYSSGGQRHPSRTTGHRARANDQL